MKKHIWAFIHMIVFFILSGIITGLMMAWGFDWTMFIILVVYGGFAIWMCVLFVLKFHYEDDGEEELV